MLNRLNFAVLGVWVGLLLAIGAPIMGHEQTHICKTCGQNTFGTSIPWVASPSAAAAQAQKEEKLVFVLHVSGHFEDPGVT